MSDRARKLHASNWSGVLHVTGGGSGFLSEMLKEPGASKTILEASIPYSEKSLSELLGGPAEQACSPSTARALAMAAFEKAKSYGVVGNFGLGCTASLATNREKKGQHRAHWAIQTDNDSFAYSATYSENRKTEEEQLENDLWASLQNALLSEQNQLSENIVSENIKAPQSWQSLLGEAPYRYTKSESEGLLLLPGSFNPIHQGHEEMLRIAEEISGTKGALELSIKNAEKPSLDYITLTERLSQLKQHPVWLTNTATFTEKSRLFPNSIFAVGIDTIKRIGEARFYNNDLALMNEAFKELVSNDTKFLVFGRLQNNQFESMEDLSLPGDLRSLCESVPEEIFRLDLSSTQLRQKIQK